MAKDILNEYGPDSHMPQVRRSENGGQMPVRDVMNYEPPTGPKYQGRTGAGLRGGTNFGNSGSQGKRSLNAEGTGSPGNHGCILNDGLNNVKGRI